MPAENGPTTLGRERQLFVDEGFQSGQQGLTRTLHQPTRHPFNPVLIGSRPWEGDRVLPGAVLRDPATGLFRMWYTATSTALKGVAETPAEKERIGYVCYAESEDGLHWRRPELGLFESSVPWQLPWDAPPALDVTRANNIVMRNLAHLGAEKPLVVLQFLCRDDADPDPDRRYKALVLQKGDRYKELDEGGAPLAGKMPSSYRAAFSPDGIHWDESGPLLVYPRFRDAGSAMHDWKNNRFVGFFKTDLREHRTRAICVSNDMLQWTEPHVILEADEDDPEHAQIYDNSAFVYESMYLGTLGLFRAGGEATICQQFVHSRDGLEWERGFGRRTFFPHGRPGVDWDGSMVRALRPPVLVGEELWFYYTGFDRRHWQNARSAAGLARLRRDGFVSLDAAGEGWMLTPPVRCAGECLYVNADAARGEIRTELCDEEGHPLEGYDRDASVPLATDSTRAPCAWKGAQSLPDRPVRLKFHLRTAGLYAVWSE